MSQPDRGGYVVLAIAALSIAVSGFIVGRVVRDEPSIFHQGHHPAWVTVTQEGFDDPVPPDPGCKRSADHRTWRCPAKWWKDITRGDPATFPRCTYSADQGIRVCSGSSRERTDLEGP